MENFINNENIPEQKKAIVRAWIYQWLATLERQDIVEAKLTQSGDTETITIKFKQP